MRVIDGEKDIYNHTGRRVVALQRSKKLAQRPLAIYSRLHNAWFTFDSITGLLMWVEEWGPGSRQRQWSESKEFMLLVGHQRYPWPTGKCLKDEVILMLHIEAGFNDNKKCQKVLDEWEKGDYTLE